MATLPPVRRAYPNVVIGEDGSPLVEGTRLPVRRIYSWHRQGTTLETLLRRYPQVGPARIFAALAFAYDNLGLIQLDIINERERAEIDRTAAAAATNRKGEAMATSDDRLERLRELAETYATLDHDPECWACAEIRAALATPTPDERSGGDGDHE